MEECPSCHTAFTVTKKKVTRSCGKQLRETCAEGNRLNFLSTGALPSLWPYILSVLPFACREERAETKTIQSL